jgi:hypothetical protein
VSVSERATTGLTALVPPPGIYCNESERYEIRRSARGHWYAMRLETDGSSTYLAQDLDSASLIGRSGPGKGTSERQPSRCAQTNCILPVWYRGLCGLHLAADAVRYAHSIKVVAA